VEQKNWTHVRQLVGYARLEGEQVTELLDELYRKEWSLFRNFFCPVMKHLRTESKASCKRRIYDQPATPLARLRACPQVGWCCHFHSCWFPFLFGCYGRGVAVGRGLGVKNARDKKTLNHQSGDLINPSDVLKKTPATR